MPTTCAVVGCNNRQCKLCGVSYYSIPKEDQDCRRQWIAFVSRKNSDGSAWKPGKGHRVCSNHFISGKKSDEPGNPDYVPSVKHTKQPLSSSNASVSRFERLSCHTQNKNKSVRI